LGYIFHVGLYRFWNFTTHKSCDRICCTFPVTDVCQINAAHSGLRRKRNEGRMRHFVELSPANSEFFGENYDTAPFRGFVG
jgi:hypothetical protein